MRNLEHSQRFLAPHLNTETAQTKEPNGQAPVIQTGVPGGVEFDILSGYNPLPASVKAPEQEQKDKGAAQEGAVKPDKPVKSSASNISGHKPANSKSAAGIKPSAPASGQKPSADVKPSAASQSKKTGKPSASGGAR